MSPSNYNRANTPCVWQPTPTIADVTVTNIAGYVRVRILMNQWFFRIFGIHTFYAMATLLNIWICMQWTDAAVVVGADWTLHPWHHNSINVGGDTAGQVRHNSIVLFYYPIRQSFTMLFWNQDVLYIISNVRFKNPCFGKLSVLLLLVFIRMYVIVAFMCN